MGFRVEASPQAFDDLVGIIGNIATQENLEVAERWFKGILASIESDDLETLMDETISSEEELQ